MKDPSAFDWIVAISGRGSLCLSTTTRNRLRTITLPWETWRSIIAVLLRAKGLPHMLDRADALEQQLEQRAPDQAIVTLHLTDDLFLRSYNWARWQLGFPLSVEG